MTIKRLLFITFYVAVLVWLFGGTRVIVDLDQCVYMATASFSDLTPFEYRVGKYNLAANTVSSFIGTTIGFVGAMVFWVALLGIGWIGLSTTTRKAK